jgi:hypothetical protein
VRGGINPHLKVWSPVGHFNAKNKKNYVFADLRKLSPKQIGLAKSQKRFGPQITNMQIATFAEGSKI